MKTIVYIDEFNRIIISKNIGPAKMITATIQFQVYQETDEGWDWLVEREMNMCDLGSGRFCPLIEIQPIIEG